MRWPVFAACCTIRLTEAASTTVLSTAVPLTSSSRMISKRKASPFVVILLQENCVADGCPRPGTYVYNEMHPANIPYAKEIFRMPKYWRVALGTRTMSRV